MAKYVFFSFAYDDVKNFKVNIVRNSWLINNKEETFVDGSIWEKSKTKGATVIKNLIHNGLKGTSTTAILIGETTSERRWVKYEIVKSFDKGNGILGVHINRNKGTTGITKRGLNPLDRLGFEVSADGKKIRFYELINGQWYVYNDLAEINNKKSNTLYFDNHWWNGNNFGKFFKFSDFFETYCWKFDDGHNNFSDWVKKANE